MKKLFIIFFVLFSNILFAKVFWGKVVNSYKKPIPDVVIYNNKEVVVSDGKGRFILSKLSNSDSLTFHKIGYEDKIVIASVLSENHSVIMKLRPIISAKMKVVGKEISVLPDMGDKITIRNKDFQNG